MKFKFIGLVISLMLFGAMPSQASTLVDQGNNTYDPNTGLVWLDVTLTTNRSYNNVVANLNNPADVVYGYRYATGAEVSTLFTDAGITNPYNGPPNGEGPAVLSLISLLGATFQPGNSRYTYTVGITGDPYSNVASARWSGVLYLLFLHNQIAESQSSGFGQDYYSSDIGSFLVATPLPATLPLFASGLGALGLLGWRRKRKGAATASA